MQKQKNKTAEQEVFKDKCPLCGLIISSSSKEQFKYNFGEHVKACRKKLNKNKKKYE